MSNQRVKKLENAFYTGNTFRVISYEFDSAPILGLGFGYYFNDWLRFDVTGEYRGKARFSGLEVFNNGAYTDEYHASKSEWLFLANAYIDLRTWYSLTPFVGAGIGTSRNTIHNFTDINTPNHGVAFGADASKWNFAWALHAGVSYKVAKNFAVELSYRYVHLGDAVTGDIVTYTGTNSIYNPMTFKDLTSHDLRLGLRMNLDGFDISRRDYSPQPVYAPAPVYAPPPQQVYTQPAPVYAPPAVRSRY